MKRIALHISIAGLLLGCGSSPDPLAPLEGAALLSSIEEREEAWLATRPERYGMVQSRVCECLPEMSGPVYMEVTRRQGATIPSPVESVTRLEYVLTGHEVPEPFRAGFFTIQGLFAFARQAAAAGAHVELETDPELGYPTYLFVDPDPTVADDEVAYRVTDLVVE